MKSFKEWLQKKSYLMEEVDPNEFNPDMFLPPSKSPFKTTSVDEIPANWLNNSITYEMIKNNVKQGYLAADEWFMDLYKNMQQKENPTMEEKIQFEKARDLDNIARELKNAIPALDKRTIYEGKNQPKINSNLLANYMKYPQLKDISAKNKLGGSAYQMFERAFGMLEKLLQDYQKSGYGHAAIAKSQSMPK